MWPPKHIGRVGIELEGGWENPPGQEMHGDVSVQINAPYVGEVSSPPLPPEKALEWMVRDDIYPDYGNATCGIHVHISTNDFHEYSLLTDPKFEAHFYAKMVNWGSVNVVPAAHPFWPRIRGENRYCKREFIPTTQMGRGASLPRDARRTQLNFCAFKKYGTLECRMIPYFANPDLAASAIREFIEITDEFIEANYNVEQPEIPLKYEAKWKEEDCIINRRKTIKCA